MVGPGLGCPPPATLLDKIVKYRHYYALLLPALAIFLLFRYIPMAGIVRRGQPPVAGRPVAP